MKIAFVYKGKYFTREVNLTEYLSSIAKSNNHSVELFYDNDVFGISDNVFYVPWLNKLMAKEKKIAGKLETINPNLVIFAVTLANYQWSLKIIKKIREKNPRITILCAGQFPNLVPEKVLENQEIDYIMGNDCEYFFEEILVKLGSAPEKIPAIWFRKDNGISFSGTKKSGLDMNKLPLPDKSTFEAFVAFNYSFTLYTSKGCIHNCSYCDEGIGIRKNDKHYQYQKKRPKNVIRELARMKERYGFREIIFKDSCFTNDKSWLKSFLPMYRQKINIPFKCFGNTSDFDKEIAYLLKENGCYCIEFGLQTWNESIRKNFLNRFETNSMIKKAFRICDNASLRYDVDHMFGLPYETLKDHIKAVREYSKLKFLNRIKVHNLVYLPRSELLRKAIKHGYCDKKYLDKIENGDETADFFNSTRENKNVKKMNDSFRKLLKVLPLFSKKGVESIIENRIYKQFRFIPKPLILLCQVIIAIRNNDLRYKFYLHHYPKKILKGFGVLV